MKPGANACQRALQHLVARAPLGRDSPVAQRRALRVVAQKLQLRQEGASAAATRCRRAILIRSSCRLPSFRTRRTPCRTGRFPISTGHASRRSAACGKILCGPGKNFGASAPAPVRHALGGWQLNGTVVRQAGAPLGLGNALFAGDIKSIALPGGQRSPDRWFNADAGFEKTTAKQLANNIQTLPIRFSVTAASRLASI